MQNQEEREKIVNYGLIHIVDNDRNIKEIFNKKTYEPEFLDFYGIFSQSLGAYCRLYEESPEPEKRARETAQRIMDHEMEKINAITKKSKRAMQMMEDSAFAALFTIPAIDRYGTEATDQLADFLIEEWHKNFPKNQIQKGKFEEINNGFKKKRFCYITTAICDSMGKPDDCYELTVLRRYRDTWLAGQPGGEALIQRYYDTAPGIIAKIDTRTDSKRIYDDVYRRYLQPCIRYIEEGAYEACKNLYIEMTEKLDKEK